MHSGVVAWVQSTHGFLGIFHYVQFTSPIQRYVDLHYQFYLMSRGCVIPMMISEMVYLPTLCSVAIALESNGKTCKRMRNHEVGGLRQRDILCNGNRFIGDAFYLSFCKPTLCRGQ